MQAASKRFHLNQVICNIFDFLILFKLCLDPLVDSSVHNRYLFQIFLTNVNLGNIISFSVLREIN